MKQQTNPIIKWILTALMFCGAITTSLQYDVLLGSFILFVGNLGWAVVLFRIREWAAMSVFVIMGTGWSLGIIKYFLF